MPYFGAIDGLRAISVIAVLIYHEGASWLPGGFLGVDVFFVISGYLITSLLIGEWQEKGNLSLKTFWLRRARRLLPELFVVLAAVLIYTAIVHRDELPAVREDALASIGYVMNWWLIFGEQSYFESWERPSVLRHLWSLAVEEQFYLAWPLAVFAVLRVTGRKAALLIVAGAGAVLSAVLMAALYQGFEPGEDLSRLYYGTDTRASAVLIGSALAVVWSPWTRAKTRHASPVTAGLVHALAAASLAGLVACFALLHDDSAILYRGGFFGVALLTAALIALVVHPAMLAAPVLLGNRLMRWLGERSYGIYLWHWPIFAYTMPDDVSFEGPVLIAVRFGLTLLLADLSYRYVAAPIRSGALVRGWTTLRRPQTRRERSLRPAALFAVLAVAGGTAFVAAEPSQSTASQPTSFTGVVTAPVTPSPSTNPENTATIGPSPTVDPNATPTVEGEATEATATNTPKPSAPLPNLPPAAISADVLAIGDSVMLGAVSTLGRAGAVQIDAAVGRQASQVPGIIDAYRSAGPLPPVVVIHIGSNGSFSRGEFDRIVDAADGVRQIVFVTVHVDRSWEKNNNAMLRSAVGAYSNTTLVDWKGATDGHDELFASDGVHLNGDGADLYARLISNAIIPPPPPTPTPEPATPTPEPETPTPSPTPTPEETPSGTPEPTATPPAATPTPEPAVSQEPSPSPEPTGTPEPSATPTAVETAPPPVVTNTPEATGTPAAASPSASASAAASPVASSTP